MDEAISEYNPPLVVCVLGTLFGGNGLQRTRKIHQNSAKLTLTIHVQRNDGVEKRAREILNTPSLCREKLSSLERVC